MDHDATKIAGAVIRANLVVVVRIQWVTGCDDVGVCAGFNANASGKGFRVARLIGLQRVINTEFVRIAVEQQHRLGEAGSVAGYAVRELFVLCKVREPSSIAIKVPHVPLDLNDDRNRIA